MKPPHIPLIILLSVITAFVVARYAGPQNGAAVTEKQSAFDRVMKTGVLRCGYYIFPPMMMRDPNTRALSGFGFDMMKQMLQDTGLKVEWAEEVDFGTWPSTLKAGRVDAICTPVWPDVALAREVAFTRPALYAGINAYARSDDHRFDHNLAAIDNPAVTIAVIEGNATQFIAQMNFPDAKLDVLPAMAPAGDTAENVVTKKADILFWDANGVYDFLKSNPGSLHNVDPLHPVKVMPFELAVSNDEPKLRDMLEVGLQNLENNGFINLLVKKWERTPGAFYPLAVPYAPAGK